MTVNYDSSQTKRTVFIVIKSYSYEILIVLATK